MNKKQITALATCVATVALSVAGATLAYFTDTDTKTNTFTSGNVKIEQYEKDRNGKDYGTDKKKLMPIVDDKVENGYHMGANYIDKIVTVKNTGTEPAYIRTHIAIPAALDDGPTAYDANANILHWNAASASDKNAAAGGEGKNFWYFGKSTATDWPGNGGEWNFYQVMIDSVKYNVYVATHSKAVVAGDTTAPNLLGVYLDADVDYNGTNYIDKQHNNKVINFDLSKDFNVIVASEAVQTEGFGNDANVAFTALDKAFGTIGSYCPFEGGTVVTAE